MLSDVPKTFAARRSRGDLLAALVKQIAPHLTNEALAELLLAAVAPQDNMMQLDSELLEGLLGADAAAFQEAAAPLPAEVAAVNAELQETAAKLRRAGSAEGEARQPYWTGVAAPAAWTKEVSSGFLNNKLSKFIFFCTVASSCPLQEMDKFLPTDSYRAHRGRQNTWEVSFLGQHLAKRSFLKYGGEGNAWL